MLNLPELVMAGSVAVVCLIGFLVYQNVMERRQLRKQRTFGTSGSDTDILLNTSDRLNPPSGITGKMDRGFERMITRTGLEISPGQALGFTALLGVILGAGLYLWREHLGLAIGGLIVGMLIPMGAFLAMQGRQRGKMQGLLPDAIYLLARSLRAGLTLEQGIKLLGDDGVPPLAEEFKRVSGSLSLGLPLEAGLQLMADRVRLTDFNAFVSTVSFHQSTGGNLPLLLDRLAASARDHNQFRGQFFASTAQGRFTSVGLALAVPLFLLAYLFFQPEHVQAFFHDPKGWTALTIAGVLEVIGCIWLYQIMSVDY